MHQDELGLLSDISRMKVAVTRARLRLLLMWDQSTRCRYSFFLELLASVRDVGGYRTARAMDEQT